MPESITIDVPAILIRIRQEYRPGMSDQALYEVTRAAWKIGPRRDAAKYVFSIFEGIVREVYEVDAWHPAGTTDYQVRPRHEVEVPGRWEFTGHPAPAEIRDRFVGHSVAATWPRGAANPITYVNVPA